MNLEEFRIEFENDISSMSIANMQSNREAFFELASDIIVEAGEILEYNHCYYEGKGKNGKKIVLDGYVYDALNKELNLIICDYRSKFDRRELYSQHIKSLVSQATAFVENYELIYNTVEESTLAFEFADWLRFMWEKIGKVRVIVLSTETEKFNMKKVDKTDIDGTIVYYNVWGLQRFFEVYNTPNANIKIEIDILEYNEKGIPALEASDSSVDDYESYLAVVPGKLLATLYDDYGAKLLEGNVRSFLSYRGKVNKAIRGTLLSRPHMFFAFNNGIAATASSVKVDTIDGKSYITNITDFQIVNGGQTTASIFNVKYVRKEADLEGVYVPMKLNVVSDEKRAEKLIPIIAETANTQNKVNKADFFANSGFHRRIEQLSNTLTAPTVEGSQYRTKWFYERARGSYEAKLISFKTSKSKKDQFKLLNPKNQKITKTDLAKYFNSMNFKPYSVSKGAQTNFVTFANDMDTIFRKNPEIINQEFYKDIIVGAIIFKALERLVSSSPWYQNAFRANIVTYSISYFYNYIKENSDLVFNNDIIWRNQGVPDDILEIFNSITYEVFIEISREVDGRTKNVTEWCKKQECWKELQKNVKVDFIREVEPFLLSRDEYSKKRIEAKKEQKKVDKLNQQVAVVQLGQHYWKKVLDFGTSKKKLFAIELDLIKMASRMEDTGRVPSEKQSKIILRVLEKMKLEGFNDGQI
jgi:hypothetical protein